MDLWARQAVYAESLREGLVVLYWWVEIGPAAEVKIRMTA